MAILSWGKCTIEHSTSTAGAPGTTWTAIDTPRLDSTKLTPTAGQTIDAQEEGGEIVDSRTGKTTYELDWYNFVKKGGTRPFTDTDGVITGEHAIRITPEDEACEGILIDRCILRVEEEYTTADGKLLHYYAKCLKPASGQTIKPYTKGE